VGARAVLTEAERVDGASVNLLEALGDERAQTRVELRRFTLRRAVLGRAVLGRVVLWGTAVVGGFDPEIEARQPRHGFLFARRDRVELVLHARGELVIHERPKV